MWWIVVLFHRPVHPLPLPTVLEKAPARGGSRWAPSSRRIMLQLGGGVALAAAQRRCGSNCISVVRQLGGAAAPTASGGPVAPTASRRFGSSRYSLKLRNRQMAPLPLVSASQILIVVVVAPCRRWHLFWLCGSLALPEASYFPRQGRLQQTHGGRRCCSGKN